MPAAPVLVERTVEQAPDPEHVHAAAAARRASRCSAGCRRRPSCSASPPWRSPPAAPSAPADPTLVGAGHQTAPTKLMQASALTGAGAVASSTVPGTRGPVVSRDSRRDAPADPADAELAGRRRGAGAGASRAARADCFDKSAD